MPDYKTKQYITEFHPDLIKAAPALPSAASYPDYAFRLTTTDTIYISDGTRWLSAQVFHLSLDPQQPIVAGTGFAQATSDFTTSIPSYSLGGTSGIYIERVAWNFVPQTVQSGVVFYTPTLQVIDATSNAVSTVTRTSGTADTKTFTTVGFFYPAETVYGAAYTNKMAIRFRLTPTGAAGTFFCQPVLQYRLVG